MIYVEFWDSENNEKVDERSTEYVPEKGSLVMFSDRIIWRVTEVLIVYTTNLNDRPGEPYAQVQMELDQE